MPWCHAGYSAADAAQFIASRAAARAAWDAFDFLIVSAQGRLLGVCGINTINREQPFRQPRLLGAYLRDRTRRCRPARWGSSRAGCSSTPTSHGLEIVAAVGNVASRRVAEKAGALREGTLRSRACRPRSDARRAPRCADPAARQRAGGAPMRAVRGGVVHAAPGRDGSAAASGCAPAPGRPPGWWRTRVGGADYPPLVTLLRCRLAAACHSAAPRQRQSQRLRPRRSRPRRRRRPPPRRAAPPPRGDPLVATRPSTAPSSCRSTARRPSASSARPRRSRPAPGRSSSTPTRR